MTTHTIRTAITWPSSQTANPPDGWNATGAGTFTGRMRAAFRYSSRMVLADAPALAIIVAAALAIDGEQSTSVLQATLWATGFVFLALAVELVDTQHFVSLLLTGVALPAFALLSYHVAVEFAVFGATLVAVWVVVTLLKYQLPRRGIQSDVSNRMSKENTSRSSSLAKCG